MTTRQELLTQWQERLADAEEACAAAPSWAERIRVKLYRFLLAMYGHTPWPGPKDDVDNSQLRAATTKLIVAEPRELAGKEPRTRAEILKGLQNLKGLGEELAPAGPLVDGLLPDSPVAVAAFKKERAASVAIRKLQRAGFSPVIAQRGGMYQIFVGASHSAEAIALLEANLPTPRPSLEHLKLKRPPQYVLLAGAIFFGAIGGLLTGILLQLVFVDLSHLSVHELPDEQEILALCISSVAFLALAALLFATWSRSKPAKDEIVILPQFVTPALCCGVVHGFLGIVLTAYLTLFLWFPPNPSITQDWLIPDPQLVYWIAAAAVCLNLIALQLLWIWYKWRRRQLANETAAETHTRGESR